MFIDNLPDTRNFEGNQGITMNLDEDDPTLMFLVEKWESKEHYEKYHHWRQENGSLEQIRSFLDGKPKRMLEEVCEENFVIGYPEECIEKINQYAELGIGEIACLMNFGGPGLGKVERSMKLLSEKVMPEFI